MALTFRYKPGESVGDSYVEQPWDTSWIGQIHALVHVFGTTDCRATETHGSVIFHC